MLRKRWLQWKTLKEFMDKKITFEELRALGHKYVPQSAEVAKRLEQKAKTELRQKMISKFVDNSQNDDEKKKRLINMVNTMLKKKDD
jgi:hypothetical protein